MTDSLGRTYRFRTLVWLISVLVFSTLAALAQLSTASLNGVVRDATNAVVSRASVTLHNSVTPNSLDTRCRPQHQGWGLRQASQRPFTA